MTNPLLPRLMYRVTLLALLLWTLVSSYGFAADVLGKSSRMEDEIGLYQADFQTVERFYSNVGWAPSYFERLDVLLGQWATRAAGLDFDSLDQQGRIDYLLLQNEVTA